MLHADFVLTWRFVLDYDHDCGERVVLAVVLAEIAMLMRNVLPACYAIVLAHSLPLDCRPERKSRCRHLEDC